VIRRLTAIAVLIAAVSAQAAPLAVAGACAMTMKASSMTCCASKQAPESATSVSAGSCCRFEASDQATRSSGVMPSTIRSESTVIALATVPGMTSLVRPATVEFGPPPTRDRSTDSPISLHTTLRL
jgi:hypothetical protein